MGLGPVPAVRKLLKKTGYTIKDMDVIELNEAFASQAIACMKELEIPRYGESEEYREEGCERVNPYGSGISLGHPIGCTGARLLVTMIHEMERKDYHVGLATLCLGGGNAVAMAVERV